MNWFAVHNDGRETELLALDGTLPVNIRGMLLLTGWFFLHNSRLARIQSLILVDVL